MDVFIKGDYMSINNPILIYVNKKRQIKLALFYSVVAIALMMSLSLNDLDYDSDELQDIFKMAVARNLEQ
ncbi:hypothetical protein KV777_003679 [Salmonella enterica subsp. enterica serovar Java]|nr:hypothetical protein [Salmonella enterica subsp. enterica serovar Java]EKD8835376.1 hypothetical protein [Salmonella enterica]ELC8168513.1 hypothetical protein [Salmonella enterica]